jgi:EAL and modified HD-GYP domain-containing signal transduction protein
MTALTATPPVFLHPLSDRHGTPAALLLDLEHPAADAGAQWPTAILRELAAGSMACYYRTGQPDAVAAVLDQAGWRALAADKLHRADTAPQQELAPAVLWLEGEWFLAPPPKPVGAQVASRALALQLVQLVAADADTHEIEAVLRQDPTLSYHLLKLVNSLSMGMGAGTGRRVTSFSQAILILGRSQLRRWLNLMLFSSREADRRSPMLLARVSVRARTMELLAHDTGLSKNQQEMAFMVGMFSLLGVLFGMALADVLKPLTISDAVQQALLEHRGELGQLLSVVEASERDDHAALVQGLAALPLAGDQFNRIMVDAYLWMQSVALGKAGQVTQAGKSGLRHA